MRRPWSAFALLAGALALLVSLYLPWQETSDGPEFLPGRGGTISGLLDLFSGNLSVDGWSSGVGDAAALFALVLAAMSALALARPNLVRRLPLGLGALLVAYFALAVAAGARSTAQQRELPLSELDFRYPGFHYTYGAYLAVAAAVLVLSAAGAMRRNDLRRTRSISELASIVLGVSLLVAFLLPWQRFEWPAQFTFLGIASPAAVVAAALTLCLLGVRSHPDAEAGAARLVLAAAAGLFTAAAFGSLAFPGSRTFGAWIGLGAALGLVALALKSGIGMARLQLPRWDVLAIAGAAALLVAGLFLPWERACYDRAGDLGPYSGRCVSAVGWTSNLGAAAALLAIGLIVVTLAPRRSSSPMVLAAGIGLLVATYGLQLANRSGGGLSLERGYGSTIGFVAAGVLVGLVAARARPPTFGWNRALVRLVPLAACTAYLVVVVLPWWDVLPEHVQSALHVAPLSWLTIAATLLAVWLLQLWVEQIARPAADTPLLFLVPLALLGVAAIELMRLRDTGIAWGHWVVLGLCLVLVLLGRVEQREGLENFRVPEIFRIDRL